MSDHTIQDDLVELLIRWQELRDQGNPITIEELCADRPESIEPLRQHIKACEKVESLLAVRWDGQSTLPFAPASNSLYFPDVSKVQVPGYEMLSVIDRGGMGVVFKARQEQPRRVVALKMISGLRSHEKYLARFRSETESLANLQHPNIVHIYEVGECQDQPFFTMEFVSGGNLAARLASGPLPLGEAVALVQTLAGAVHAAHQQGIVHRDLKPSNILLSGEGIPKISDFGIAKRLDDDSSHTQSGEVLGTPCYMAPEQAEGNTKDVGTSADIYALGAILYESLTGSPPFRGKTPLELMRKVASEDPAAPSHVKSDIPRDLDAICLKCLEKQPRHRYADAASLGDDLQRFQTGLPIVARPISNLNRLVKWSRRRPELALLLSLLALALIGGAAALVNLVLQKRRVHLAAVEAAPKVREILHRHCYECHGDKATVEDPELYFLEHDLLFDPKRPLIIPGAPSADSRLIQRIEDGSMPPVDDETRLPRVSEQELAILRTWIKGGAPPFPPEDPDHPTPAVVPHSDLAFKVKKVFYEKCYHCHQYTDPQGGISILNYRLLRTTRKVIIPNHPELSEIYTLITRKDKEAMPPPGETPLTPEEIELIHRWLAEGAPPFPKGEVAEIP